MKMMHWWTLGLLLTGCGAVSQPPRAVPLQTSDTTLPQPSGLTARWASQITDLGYSDTDGAKSFSWSPDSARLYWSAYTTGYVWSSAGGPPTLRQAHPVCNFNSLYVPSPLSPDGSKFLCGKGVYTSDFSKLLYTLPFETDGPYGIPFAVWSPDSQSLAAYVSFSYSNALGVFIIDAQTGQRRSVPLNNGTFFYAERLAWKADSSAVLYGNSLFNPTTGAAQGTVNNLPSGSSPLSPDWHLGIQVQSTYTPVYQEKARVLDLASGAVLFETPFVAGSIQPVWNTAGSQLALGARDHIEVWDVASGSRTVQFPVPNREGYASLLDLHFSPDGLRLAALVNTTQTILMQWDLSTQTLLPAPTPPRAYFHATNVYSLSLDPQGVLYSTGRDGTRLSWDTASGLVDPPLTLSGDAVYALAFRPGGGGRFASAGIDSTIRLWSPVPGAEPQQTASLSGHTYTVRSLAWNPDGSRLASGSWDSSVRLWNPDTGDQTKLLSGHTDYVNAVAYNPSGTLLASASNDRTVKLWDPSSGTNLKTLSGHSDAVLALAWSPDGTRLATGSAGGDRSVRLWNAASGLLERTLSGSYGAVRAVAWSGNGTLYAVGDDGYARAWNAATGERTLEQSVSPTPLFSLTLSTDGKTLFTGAADGRVSTWSVQ